MTNLTEYRAEQIADEAARRLTQPELKPCPFCGGEAICVEVGIVWQVFCRSCRAEIMPYSGKPEAIEAWNTRAAERTCRDEFNGKAWCFKCDICGCAMPWKDSFSSKTIRDFPLHYCPSCGAKVVD